MGVVFGQVMLLTGSVVVVVVVALLLAFCCFNILISRANLFLINSESWNNLSLLLSADTSVTL